MLGWLMDYLPPIVFGLLSACILLMLTFVPIQLYAVSLLAAAIGLFFAGWSAAFIYEGRNR